MCLTQSLLYKNALIASISHAVMTNILPDLSYEQSWDKNHYCFQDISNTTGVISFYSDYCICAVRNDERKPLNICQALESIKNYLTNDRFDEFVHNTLQYTQCGVDPRHMHITAIALIDTAGIQCWSAKGTEQDLSEGMPAGLWMCEEQCKDFWREYYDMDSATMDLISSLVEHRMTLDNNKAIIMSEHQTKQIPGAELCTECIQAFSELNIQFTDEMY